MSVLGYVRSRRSQHAEDLLMSTTLPIKAIARAVGVPDLQQFNRLMRDSKGLCPRAIRERASAEGLRQPGNVSSLPGNRF